MGLRESHHINRIVIDPTDNNIVFVAATGPLFGPGGERGVYKTTDGGAHLEAGAQGRRRHGRERPRDVGDRSAASCTRRCISGAASQCCMNGGGPGSGIWKSTDGGETWTRLTATACPTGPLGRIALDVYRSSAQHRLRADRRPRRWRGGGGGGGGGRRWRRRRRGGAAGAAAAVAARRPGGGGGGTGLYRSDDGGATWRRVSTRNPRPMYFSQVRIDPNNPDRVYIGGVGVHMTIDGGRTMETDVALVIHDDIHAIWINPANSESHPDRRRRRRRACRTT